MPSRSNISYWTITLRSNRPSWVTQNIIPINIHLMSLIQNLMRKLRTKMSNLMINRLYWLKDLIYISIILTIIMSLSIFIPTSQSLKYRKNSPICLKIYTRMILWRISILNILIWKIWASIKLKKIKMGKSSHKKIKSIILMAVKIKLNFTKIQFWRSQSTLITADKTSKAFVQSPKILIKYIYFRLKNLLSYLTRINKIKFTPNKSKYFWIITEVL